MKFSKLSLYFRIIRIKFKFTKQTIFSNKANNFTYIKFIKNLF